MPQRRISQGGQEHVQRLGEGGRRLCRNRLAPEQPRLSHVDAGQGDLGDGPSGRVGRRIASSQFRAEHRLGAGERRRIASPPGLVSDAGRAVMGDDGAQGEGRNVQDGRRRLVEGGQGVVEHAVVFDGFGEAREGEPQGVAEPRMIEGAVLEVHHIHSLGQDLYGLGEGSRVAGELAQGA